MLREKLKWRPHESESTDAEHRGGLTRSSDEVPVNRGGAKELDCPAIADGSTRNGRNLFG